MNSLSSINIHTWIYDKDIAKLLHLPLAGIRVWCANHKELAQRYSSNKYRMAGGTLLRCQEQLAREVRA